MPAYRNDKPNPLDNTGLCLLSLDGGGVQGLSTLYILKNIINYLNNERTKSDLLLIKLYEIFNLIEGISTGGRLEMDVDKCITAYSELAEVMFREKLSSFPFSKTGKAKARFDSAKLKKAVRKAALTTSIVITFFDSVSIEDRSFADGGLGFNNPVDELLVKCFIFIRTGNLSKKAFEDSLVKFLSQMVDLQSIKLNKYKKKGAIKAVIKGYLNYIAQKLRVRDYIQNLRLKQNMYIENFA
ncbi:phospholipase, patatin family protein [Rhexocercosporidium sp. MPI-PUGE-AT-0058]|nr:phospholipase, patatin family protein [Rhexocercosporidium sp. MPI-PUGE-AT-0058]